jgi:hypothetical protein
MIAKKHLKIALVLQAIKEYIREKDRTNVLPAVKVLHKALTLNPMKKLTRKYSTNALYAKKNLNAKSVAMLIS